MGGCATGVLCVNQDHKVKFIVFNYYYNKVSMERKLPTRIRSYYSDDVYSSGDPYNTPVIEYSSNLGHSGILITF